VAFDTPTWKIAALAAALFFAPARAHAEPSPGDRETARALLDEGDEKFAAKDYAAALKAYRAAYALVTVPTTGVEVAKAQAALGQLVEARDTALAVTRLPRTAQEPAPFTKARAQASDLAQSLLARIPSIEVSVVGARSDAARVTIDGEALPPAAATLPHKVDPGKHTVVVSAAGFADAAREVTIGEGANAKVTLTMTPSTAPSERAPPTSAGSLRGTTPSAPPNDARGGTPAWAYAGFAVGGVGLAVGAVSGLMSLSKASSAKTHCTGDHCAPDAKDDISSSKTTATISNIAFGAGAAGIVVGVIGVATSGETSRKETRAAAVHVVPFIGAGEAGVRGSFQ